MGNITSLNNMFDDNSCLAVGSISIVDAVRLECLLGGDLVCLMEGSVPSSIAKLFELFVYDIGCQHSLLEE